MLYRGLCRGDALQAEAAAGSELIEQQVLCLAALGTGRALSLPQTKDRDP